MLRETTSAASGRRNGSDGHAPQTARPTNTATPRIIVSLERVTSRSGRPGFAAHRTLRPLSTAISRTSVALPGPSARTATKRPWAAGSSGPTCATNVSGPNTAPGCGRDDDIAATAQLAEAGCVAVMPSNLLPTSFVPMVSTRRSPNAGSIHRRTLNAYVFRVAGFQRSAQSARNVREAVHLRRSQRRAVSRRRIGEQRACRDPRVLDRQRVERSERPHPHIACSTFSPNVSSWRSRVTFDPGGGPEPVRRVGGRVSFGSERTVGNCRRDSAFGASPGSDGALAFGGVR